MAIHPCLKSKACVYGIPSAQLLNILWSND
jgi:hypothetical protein